MTKLNDKIKLIEFTTRFVDPQPTLAIFSIDYIIYGYLTIAIRKMYHGGGQDEAVESKFSIDRLIRMGRKFRIG